MNRTAAVSTPEATPFNVEMLRFDAERWEEISEDDDSDCVALCQSYAAISDLDD